MTYFKIVKTVFDTKIVPNNLIYQENGGKETCLFFSRYKIYEESLLVGEPEIQKLEKSGRKVAEF